MKGDMSAALDSALAKLADAMREVQGIKKRLSQFIPEESSPTTTPTPDPSESADRFMSTREVVKRTSLSRTTLWAASQRDDFPKSVKLSKNRVGWRAVDVERWMAQRS